MRLVLRFSILLTVAGLAWSQALTDAAGIVAGGSVGTGAGKKVGQGVAAVLQNVNATATKAARTEKPNPKIADKSSAVAVLQTGPGGVVKDHSLVPPPPPKKVAAVVPPPPPLTPSTPAVTTPRLVLPPPRQATAEDLKTVASGTSKAEVLKLGAPSSRVTMFEEGHLVEIFRYQARDFAFGIVRLSDGSVTSVQVR
jgi:hypothetical protein